MLRKKDEHAHGLSTGVGWVSLGIGLALTLAPNKSARFSGIGRLSRPSERRRSE